MDPTQRNVAVVFGASGISGWAVMQNLLSYPSRTTFSRIIGLTNRPLTLEQGGFPADDERVELYSGINLRQDLEAVRAQLKEKVPRLDEVTNVYYLAFANATAYGENVDEIRDINVDMTTNAVLSCDILMPRLKYFVLQTGTNHYGVAVVRYLDKIQHLIKPPLREDAPRIPSPYGDEIFYYKQVDVLREESRGKSWGWCEVRPDQIIGYNPNPTMMNGFEPIALYLALYRFVHGPGAVVPFPGTQGSFEVTYTDSSQDIIARAEIYLSVEKPDEAHGEAFNIADTATPGPWKVKWPILASYFGLEGGLPRDNSDGWNELERWWDAHQEEYQERRRTFGLQERVLSRGMRAIAKFSIVTLDKNREFSLDKIRGLGFAEEEKVGHGHIVALDRMAARKIIPSKWEWENL